MKLYDWEGEQLTLKEISARTGKHTQTIRNRLKQGEDIYEAATRSVRRAKRHEFQGEMLSVIQISARTGIPQSTLYDKIRLYGSADAAAEKALQAKEPGARPTRQKGLKLDRMGIAERIRDSMYGDLGTDKAKIRPCGTAGGLAFGEGLYRFELQFLGSERVAVTAIFRKTGRISGRWEYTIANGTRLVMTDRAQTTL